MVRDGCAGVLSVSDRSLECPAHTTPWRMPPCECHVIYDIVPATRFCFLVASFMDFVCEPYNLRQALFTEKFDSCHVDLCLRGREQTLIVAPSDC